MRYFKRIVGIFFSWIIFLIIFAAPHSFANNLTISNVSVASWNSQADTVTIQFDVSWDHSWRVANMNYDAAWVFIKFRYTDIEQMPSVTSPWTHAVLKKASQTNYEVNPSGYSRGTGTVLDILLPDDDTSSSDGVYGVFLYRSDNGMGPVNTDHVQLVVDYSGGRLPESASDIITFRVFGLEMVYIPQGSFYCGDTTDSSTDPTGALYGSSPTTPCQITSEDPLTLGSGGNIMSRWLDSDINKDDFDGATQQTLPAEFPKGYHAFFLMKYELTQGQYTAFLNTLNRRQQSANVLSVITGNTINRQYVMTNESRIARAKRSTIMALSTGNGTEDPVNFYVGRPYRAANWLTGYFYADYADWAALRPVTELEIEKAARGAGSSIVNGEYAWGTASITAAQTISGTEDGSETITTAGAQAAYGAPVFSGGDSSSGPLRVGIFASGTSGRIQSGAGYYGNMELSGNLNERAMSIGKNREFTGLHGNGTVTASGYSDVSYWPYNPGPRMGSYKLTSARLRVSDRNDVNRFMMPTTYEEYGGRYGRTDPR